MARILAYRHGLTAYHYDYHDARAHNDRRIAERIRRKEPPAGPDLDDIWVDPTPEQVAATTLAGFPDRFEWALDDLRALVSPRPIIAEGWGLRPELVLPLVESATQMVVMIPTEQFWHLQLERMPRASTFAQAVSDPERGQRNRLARDRLVGEDAVRSARRLGVRVVEVDGSRNAEGIADLVGDHFQL